MNPNPDPLEKVVDQALKSLPVRRAPSSLEARVLAEIARREALPWWHRSWTYWPTAVRWAFLVVSAALAAGVIAAVFALFHSSSAQVVEGAVAEPIGWLQAAKAVFGVFGRLGSQLLDLVPTPWLYGCIGGVVLAYLLLIGVGATAYRTLWQPR
ncbi:hypothetical protein DB347_04130 [Opitutaceae bacterium EW11]|nr:hypothetical protein DB347_04130 [Opitutaceae bacterium EW11]